MSKLYILFNLSKVISSLYLSDCGSLKSWRYPVNR
nr:MAG TPA: hypothetical protein [Caudoviricetes sp.]